MKRELSPYDATLGQEWQKKNEYGMAVATVNIVVLAYPFEVLGPEILIKRYRTWQKRFEQQDGGR